MYEPSVFVPAFSVLLESILSNLLAPSVAIRTQACHALGGLAYASTRIPVSQVHTYMSDIISNLLRPAKTTSPVRTTPSSPSKDPAIIRTVRTTLEAQDPPCASHGPVWGFSVLAHFVVLLGPALRMSKPLQRVFSAMFSLAMRHPFKPVRMLGCAVWRVVIWSYFRPPPVSSSEDAELEDGTMAKPYEGLDDEIDLEDLLGSLPPAEQNLSTLR